MSDKSAMPLPRIELVISEVVDGYTATIWLRTSSSQAELLTDEAVQTIGRPKLLLRHSQK